MEDVEEQMIQLIEMLILLATFVFLNIFTLKLEDKYKKFYLGRMILLVLVFFVPVVSVVAFNMSNGDEAPVPNTVQVDVLWLQKVRHELNH